MLVFAFLLAFSCSKPIEEPKDLISKNQMSEMIAEFALADQMSFLNQQGNMEIETRFILKKYGVTSKQFTDSYKFYLASPTALDKIYNDAQGIIISKDPDAKKYIEKKLEETKTTAPYLNR